MTLPMTVMPSSSTYIAATHQIITVSSSACNRVIDKKQPAYPHVTRRRTCRTFNRAAQPQNAKSNQLEMTAKCAIIFSKELTVIDIYLHI